MLPGVELAIDKNKKEVNMKKVLIIVAAVAFFVLVLCAGDLDHHEYIEANLRNGQSAINN